MQQRPPRVRLIVAAAVLAALVQGSALAWAQVAGDTRAAVTRTLTLLRAVAEEYREALDEDGKVVRPIEIEEARLFLAEARSHARRLGPQAPPDLDARIGALGDGITATVPLATLQAQVDAACELLTKATGVGEEFLPPSSPSAARGATIYTTHCVSCHGELGAGDGPEAARLDPKPADFSAPSFMRAETPSDFFHVISAGRRRAAMPAWDSVLNVQERWDAIAYLWTFSTSPARLAEGQGVFVAHCAGCHGATADGRGAYAATLSGGVPDLSVPGALAGRTQQDLFAAVSDGMPGTAMPPFAGGLDEDQRWKAVEFLRMQSLGGHGARVAAQGVGTAAGERSSAAADEALAEIRRLLAASADAHRGGDAAARDLATDAYLAFEPLEAHIAAHDPALVGEVEAAFLKLRSALATPGADVGPLFEATDRALTAAWAGLASPTDRWARFGQSATIILREGFEIVLILGALLTYVVKSGHPQMRRPIWAGGALGLVASLATAVLLMTVFRLSPALAEILEGAAMLLASVVLFWVSYWIVSKSEAERWQRYIQGKVQRALAAGSGATLAAAAFLAVYREGFETVLFYQALIGSAPAGDMMIALGFVSGTALLAVVWMVFSRLGLRLPIRQFFLVSGALLSYMAIVFAGKGVSELQGAGVVPITPVAWAPHVPLFGIFPTVETLVAQGVFVALLVFGIGVTFRGRRRGDTSALRRDLDALRQEAEGMRRQLSALRPEQESGPAAALDARLRGLIDRVLELESRVPPGNGRG